MIFKVSSHKENTAREEIIAMMLGGWTVGSRGLLIDAAKQRELNLNWQQEKQRRNLGYTTELCASGNGNTRCPWKG